MATLVIALVNEASKERLRRVFAAVPEGHRLLDPLLRNIVRATGIGMDDLDRIGRETRSRDWEEVMEAIAEEWRNTGRAEGRAETLLRLLANRYGSVSVYARSRVFAASNRTSTPG